MKSKKFTVQRSTRRAAIARTELRIKDLEHSLVFNPRGIAVTCGPDSEEELEHEREILEELKSGGEV